MGSVVFSFTCKQWVLNRQFLGMGAKRMVCVQLSGPRGMDQASWSRAVTRVRPARFSGIPVWWARRKCCWENFQKWSGNTPRCSFLPWSLSSWGIIQVFFCQGKFAAYLPHGLQAFSSKLGEGRGDRFMAHATQRVPIACTGLSRVASEIRKHLEQTQWVTHIKCQGKLGERS